MSLLLLEKLKKKPTPQEKKEFNILITKPDVVDFTPVKINNLTIIDKSKDNTFDRNQFLNTLEKPNIINKTNKLNKQDKLSSNIIKIFQNDNYIKNIKKTNRKIFIIPDKISSLNQKVKDKTDQIDEIDDNAKQILSIKKKKPNIISDYPITDIIIDGTPLEDRLPIPKPNIIMKAPSYYMNNRIDFINKIKLLFLKYEKTIDSDEQIFSCNNNSNDNNQFNMLTHQKIVRDYINIYTPYRGTLLYHGLGSGKSCSSIAIAEGMKNDKNVIILTPASLRTNYIEELKKCGDELYKKNQYWEFIPAKTEEIVKALSSLLNLPIKYIKENKGAWLVDVKKEPNFDQKSAGEKKLIDNQLDEMIKSKYAFISYNGIRESHLRAMTENYNINPFDNKVIIIDEAHNLVGRIVNKLNKSQNNSLSIKLYEYLLRANNCKIILLSGTPIINYPNEIAILFNILRGYIKVFNFKLNINTNIKFDIDSIKKIFKKENIIDEIDYINYKSSTNKLEITLNPLSFTNDYNNDIYNGVKFNKIYNKYNDIEFVSKIITIMEKYKIKINKDEVTIDNYKCLPDNQDEFNKLFITNNKIKNENLFKKRILGLVSYYKSAQESLMPLYNESTNLSIVDCSMSDFQFGVYEEARVAERKLEKSNAKKTATNDIYNDSVSTYRIFSRAFCNYVFPKPFIKRPMPKINENIDSILDNNNLNENILDALTIEDDIDNDKIIKKDDLELMDNSYESRIKQAIKELSKYKDKYLNMESLKIYSPKFLNILENIQNEDSNSLHLIYSQFRTLEGIGIFKLVLEANGFAEFKIRLNSKNEYVLNINDINKGKPMFVLYTGTEKSEEKEIIRNIYNNNWKFVPNSIVKEIEKISSNNNYGEIIKVFMITSSGAEGISLKNTRYVHIMEPYWHPVRIEQVIGRARRICSHTDLPKELQNVKVYIYLSVFTNEQLKSDDAIELKINDRSKLDNKTPITTDQLLFEISNIKKNINNSILKNIKEAAFDCAIYNKPDNEESLQCFNIQSSNPNDFLYKPNINDNSIDNIENKNIRQKTITLNSLKIKNKEFAYNKDNGNVYDFDSYKINNLIQVGNLEFENGKPKFIKNNNYDLLYKL